MGVGSVRARVATVGQLAAGDSLVVEAAGRSVAVFNVDGNYYAIDNSCPHRGGPLSEGDLDGRVIACPWHAWRWDVTTGANVNNPAVRVACFPVHVEGDGIFVDVTADA
jgi:nitrite reductase (NADH) small subunit